MGTGWLERGRCFGELPQSLHFILVEYSIRAHDRHTQRLGLGYQQPVERIAMVEGKKTGLGQERKRRRDSATRICEKLQPGLLDDGFTWLLFGGARSGSCGCCRSALSDRHT